MWLLSHVVHTLQYTELCNFLGPHFVFQGVETSTSATAAVPPGAGFLPRTGRFVP